MIKIRFFPVIVTLVMSWVLFNSPIKAAEKSPIYIGALYSQNGALSSLGTPAFRGAQLAIADLNAQGGIAGHPVKLKAFNTQSSMHITQQMSEELAQMNNVPIITGLVDDNLLQAAMPEIVKNHKLFITAGATSGKLAQDYPHNLVLACYTDAMQGKAAARFSVESLHANNVIIIENNQMQYAMNAAKAFKEELNALGGQSLKKLTFNPETVNVNKLIQQLKPLKTQTQAIYFASGIPKSLSIIAALRNNGFEQPIIGADGFDSNTFIGSKSPALKNVFFTTHAFLSLSVDSSGTQNFIQHYEKAYHTAPTNAFSALGYDATMLAAALLARSHNPDKVALSQLPSTSSPHLGASGEISYAGHNTPQKDVYIIQIKAQQRKLASVIKI